MGGKSLIAVSFDPECIHAVVFSSFVCTEMRILTSSAEDQFMKLAFLITEMERSAET